MGISSSVSYNEEAIPGRHIIHYRTRDAHREFPERDVEVLATPQELDTFARDGYLVRESLLPEAEIRRMREALDETVDRDSHLERGGGRAFGGVFIRHLMDKHPAFLEFLRFQPTLSVARAMLGPHVQVRGFTARVCYPEQPEKETEWHFHQRVISDPLPPWFSMPQTIDVLLYLDDIDETNGPLCVVPGSHNWLDRDLPTNDFANQPGQVVLKLPAGSAVLCSGLLWHRGMPTRPGCGFRRLLLYGYGPAWHKPSIYGVKPENGLTSTLLVDADEETRELLGEAGFM